MPRGGYRPGSGSKPTWKHGKTTTIRVPVALVEKTLEIARILDEEDVGAEEVKECDVVNGLRAGAKVIDLTGIAIRSTKDGPAVYLADLARAGYKILPVRLAQSLRRESGLSSLKRRVDEAVEQLKYLDGEV